MLHLLGAYNDNDNSGDFFFANMFEGCRKGVSQKTLCKILKGSGSGRVKITSEEITLFSNPWTTWRELIFWKYVAVRECNSRSVMKASKECKTAIITQFEICGGVLRGLSMIAVMVMVWVRGPDSGPFSLRLKVSLNSRVRLSIQ